ncbi:MAG: peptidase S41 [Shackletoniella antarctica]|uniref:Peptidase S41 n=1 Tax=Shackletoniella antarctica TaxID=268115 RepID=A0A2W4XC89_9CYAN|nr:MAG: peptidase S41 [Shackletoniella antarctica]
MSTSPFSRLLSVVRPAAQVLALAALATVAAEASLAAIELTELEDSPKVVIDEAWQIINREYVDGSFNQTDWQATRQDLLGREYSSQEAAYTALRAALRRLNDPYTRFLSPAEYTDLTDQTSGEVSGIGVSLERNSQTGAVLVIGVSSGSPAERSGVIVGDRILVIDGQGTERLTVEGVQQQLRGSEGSQVTLTVSRNGGAPRTIILTRAVMELPTVEYSQKTVGGRPIGYIRLIEFNANASTQMATAIRTLSEAGVEGFVLDLRGNPGGLLMASIDISRMWLQHGPIVRTLDRSGNDEAISANRTALTGLPLTVLVDGRSASSSEILTGALRDNNRATVVGATTFGKALVQSLHGLTDGSGLTVTVAHYYTPNGTDISTKGITPDVPVDLSAQQRRELFGNPALLGTDVDTQYRRAAEVLEQTILASQNTPATVGASRLGRITSEE